MTECSSLDTRPETSAFRRWLAVFSLACGTFALVNTEFLPIGLLSPIAQSLGVTEGHAGLAVMLPGLVAAISAPLIMLFARFSGGNFCAADHAVCPQNGPSQLAVAAFRDGHCG